MVNAWSLLYDELNGTMDENFPIKNTEPDDKIFVSTGSTASMGDFVTFNVDDQIDTISIDTSNYETLDLTGIELPDGMSINEEYVTGIETPTPGIQNPCNRKYKEDESIKALQDYISTTYGGHYTSDNNDVQTLDLIESVGDAESFCRSNAIKYLSRYDKKGQAKRDILKALHYTLLLYHFSGQLNETPTRGYETF